MEDSVWVGLFTVCFYVSAQISKPVKWSYTTKHIKDNIVEIQIKATVEKDWHLYSQFNTEGITQQTVFSYDPSSSYQLIGKTSEPPYKEFTDDFGTDRYFNKTPVIFKQRIKVLSEKDFDIIACRCAGLHRRQMRDAGDDFSFHIKGIPQKKHR